MIHVLDTYQVGRRGIVAALALETPEGIALFDTGPESTFDTVAAGLKNIGADVEDVRHVFLSHIHFDHAGAAWRFAERGATIYVHPRGAPHLVDPTKLAKSAARIFGDDMQRLWGRIAPVPEPRISVLEDGDVVRISGIEVRAIATPGHANHHHVYHWEDKLYGGDIAGVRLGGGPPLPPFVPPDLHVESWLESIDKLRAATPAVMYLPHFGEIRDCIGTHLDSLEGRVRDWADWFRDRIRAGYQEPQITSAFTSKVIEELRANGVDQTVIHDYETADPSFMAVPAALRYWRKYHDEQVEPGAESLRA